MLLARELRECGRTSWLVDASQRRWDRLLNKERSPVQEATAKGRVTERVGDVDTEADKCLADRSHLWGQAPTTMSPLPDLAGG